MADEGSDTSDESLDVRSEKFDPLKALYSSKVRLASSVPIFDNISKFESILKGINVSTKVRIAHCLLLSSADFFYKSEQNCRKGSTESVKSYKLEIMKIVRLVDIKKSIPNIKVCIT